MASSKRIINVGASARASDVQKVSDVAAAADDRATEILCTPGINLKTIKPLSEESATVNPRLLVVGQDTDGTVPNGKVRVRPAHFQAASDAYTIALSAALKANSDSPTIGNNSSGSTRTDLLYAVISYGTTTTETVRQKPTSGSTPVSVSLTTQKDMLVTIAVVAGVASGNPLASLPADDTVNGVYNFGLAALAIPNGFTGGAINQSVITQLWTGGWVRSHRVHGLRIPSMFTTGSPPNEKPATPFSDRWGGLYRMVFPIKHLTTTGAAGSTGAIIDGPTSGGIDWRNRAIWGQGYYIGSAVTTLENAVTAVSGGNPAAAPQTLYLSGAGSNGAPHGPELSYNGGTSIVELAVDTTGNLRMTGGVPIDATNGDLILWIVEFTDRLVF